jgi:hypothetical protein
MHVRAVFLIAFLFLAACGTTDWVNTMNPKANYAHDYNQCERRAMDDPKGKDLGGNRFFLDKQIEKCMTKLGWVQRERR